MRGLRVALGILDIAAGGSLVAVYYIFWFLEWGVPDAFTWGLPALVAAALALIGGIYTLVKKGWGWTITGLVATAVGWIYFLFLSWVVSWTMA
jgi:hypothetical protein